MLFFLFTALSYTFADSVGEYFWILLLKDKNGFELMKSQNFKSLVKVLVKLQNPYWKCRYTDLDLGYIELTAMVGFTCQRIHIGSSDAVWAPVAIGYPEQH